MKKGATFVYMHGGDAYINLTNRCCNDCAFCLRNGGDGIEGKVLWLKREPSAAEVIEQLKRLGGNFGEVVFCGYGEPTYQLNEIGEVSAYAHSVGKKTRLNTNGLGSLINGFDIVPRLAGNIDSVSVSLNESSAAAYMEICRPVFGEKAYGYLLDFAAACVKAGIKTTLTVVDVIGKEKIEQCRAAAGKIGAQLRIRTYIGDNENYR